MAVTIADILNQWNEVGVFSYVLPFLLIFAVVYAIVDKTKLLASKDKDNNFVENKGITAIIAVSVALLSLQFDIVSNFFAVIFPRFGVGLSFLLVFIIMIGFFMGPSVNGKVKHGWFGWLIVAGVAIWSIASAGVFGGSVNIAEMLGEYFWSLVVLAIIVVAILAATGKLKIGGGGKSGE